MSKIYCFLMLLLMCLSCSEELVVDVPDLDEEGEIVTVSFGVRSEQRNTRMWYDQNGQGKFDVKWNKDDSIAIIGYRKGYVTRKARFDADREGAVSVISGDIVTWYEDRDLLAIYPYRDDLYSHRDGVFTHSAENQLINLRVSSPTSGENTQNSMSNSILLSKAKGARFDNLISQELNVDHLHFKQAMSFLRFTVTDSVCDYKLNKMWLWDTTNSFVTQSKLWLDDNAVMNYEETKSSSIVTATFEKQDIEGQAIINFALFPTTLSNAILCIQAEDGDGKKHFFFKKLPSSLEFKRNIFNYFGTVLNLDRSADFTKVSNIYHLDAFTATSPIPEEDEWVILSNSVISASDLDHLNNKIANAGRGISLKFLTVTEIKGDRAFAEVDNLAVVELPHCEKIGDYTFWHCPKLKKVVMPALGKAGVWTFDDNIDDLPYVEFIVATNPGVKLEYGGDGTKDQILNRYRLERVLLTIGNKSLYEEEIGDDYIIFEKGFLNPGRRQYFRGEINWQ